MEDLEETGCILAEEDRVVLQNRYPTLVALLILINFMQLRIQTLSHPSCSLGSASVSSYECFSKQGSLVKVNGCRTCL